MVDVIKTILNNIIGVYSPVTYTSYLSDGTEISIIPDGLSGVDFPYIISGAIIVVSFYALLRIIGGIIKNV